MNCYNSQVACKSLLSSGLSRDTAYPILNVIHNWNKACGSEWTVDRLKELKNGYIRKMTSGDHGLQGKWIKYDSFGPKGPLRNLYKVKKPHKAISALMVYSTFKAKRTTEKQAQKFYGSVERHEPFNGRVIEDVRLGYKLLGLRPQYGTYWEPQAYASRNVRVSFVEDEYDFEKRKAYSVWKTVPMQMDAIIQTTGHPLLREYMEAKAETSEFNSFVPGDPRRYAFLNEPLKKIFLSAVEYEDNTDFTDMAPEHWKYVGQVSHIQEPGLKLRAVANPYPSFNLYLSQFGTTLYRTLRTIPEDHTFDQREGLERVQSALRAGIRLSSLDLSDATNTFPVKVTEFILRDLLPKHQLEIDLWLNVSKGLWYDPYRGETQWRTGQPLGMFPSFAAFALSHHCVVKSTDPKFYAIIGDDVVIDSESAVKLRALYKSLGLQLSESKCLEGHVAEFGGKIITKDSIIHQPKWREISDRSFLDVTRQLGPSVKGFLKPRQRQVVELFSEVPKDIHPFGLNWNPKGKTYNQRVQESQTILQRWGETLHTESYRSATSKSLELLRTLIECEPYLGRRAFQDVAERQVEANCLPLERRVLEIAGVTQVDSVNPIVGWSLGQLYGEKGDPRGPSTLEVVENRLGGSKKDFQRMARDFIRQRDQKTPQARDFGFSR